MLEPITVTVRRPPVSAAVLILVMGGPLPGHLFREPVHLGVVACDGGAAEAAPEPRPAPVGQAAPAEPVQRLAEARQWMVDHLGEEITLDALAARVFLSRRQFTRTFRAETGTSPWQWLLAQRLAAARRMLEGTDDPVESIARRCGFPTPVAFRARFKKAVGASPSVYRRRARTAAAGDQVVDLGTYRRNGGRSSRVEHRGRRIG
jgi:AraC-like DNA-binding protein